MAIKDICFKHVDIWIILEFIWNNFDTFRALIQDNTMHFFSEFVSDNIETFRERLSHKTPVRVHVNQNWHFWRATIKQYHTHFSEFISHKAFPESYYKMKLHIFSEFLSNNIYTYRVTTKQYCKIILFYKFLSNKTHIFRELLPNILQTFSTEDVPDNTSFSLKCEPIPNLYWLYWYRCKEHLQKNFLKILKS